MCTTVNFSRRFQSYLFIYLFIHSKIFYRVLCQIRIEIQTKQKSVISGDRPVHVFFYFRVVSTTVLNCMACIKCMISFFFWPHRKFCNDAFAITTESNSTVFCSLTPNSVYWLHYAMIRSKNKIDSFTYTLTHTNTLKIKPKKIKQMSSLILNTIVSSKFYVFQILINFSHCVCQPKIHNTSKSQQKKKKNNVPCPIRSALIFFSRLIHSYRKHTVCILASFFFAY